MCARYTRESLVITPQPGIAAAPFRPRRPPTNSAPTPPGPSNLAPPEYARKHFAKSRLGRKKNSYPRFFCPISSLRSGRWRRRPLPKYIARATTGAYKGTANTAPSISLNLATKFDRKFQSLRRRLRASREKPFLQRPQSFSRFLWPWKRPRRRGLPTPIEKRNSPATPIFHVRRLRYVRARLPFFARATLHGLLRVINGIVTCMPRGRRLRRRPTMDERIRNLDARARPPATCCSTFDDPDLGPQAPQRPWKKLVVEADSIRDSIGRTVVFQPQGQWSRYGHLFRR